jgi:hypothetical protein
MMTKLDSYNFQNGGDSSYSKLDAPSGTAISLANELSKIAVHGKLDT